MTEGDLKACIKLSNPKKLLRGVGEEGVNQTLKGNLTHHQRRPWTGPGVLLIVGHSDANELPEGAIP